jgi:hypothetical protein
VVLKFCAVRGTCFDTFLRVKGTMRAFLAVTCFGSAFLLATVSWAAAPEGAKAATLEPVKGDVWVNHGQGFEKVNSQIEAKVGDSVMVSPGGYAKVTYADKCEANVNPGAVVTIAPLSPCASGSMAADLTPHPMYTKAPVAAPAEAYPPLWPLGFVAVGGGVIGCFASGLCESGSH